MPSPAQPWRWITFFVLLACLATAGVTIPIVYNLGQQMKPEQLSDARERWRRNGPANYDLTYAITYDRERFAERHVVLVRDGAVVFASCEGEVVTMSPAISALVGLPARGASEPARDVPAIFAHLDELAGQQPAEGRKNFLIAVFDPREGYPRRFIWRIRGTKTREEWDVRVWPAGALEKEGKR